MSNMSQENKILEFMRNHGTITQREAFYLGCQRLASRICDLKKRGIVINKEMIPVKNADGTKSHVARYSIGKEQNG